MKTMHPKMASSFVSVSSTRSEPVSIAARSEPAPSIHGQGAMCPTCSKGHIVQAVEGRYILADYLDQYLRIKHKDCLVSRLTRLEHHIITVPEVLHEREIQYLQQATTRKKFRPNFIVPLHKAKTI